MALNMRSPVVRSKCDAKVERLVPPPYTRTRLAWWKQSGSSPQNRPTDGPFIGLNLQHLRHFKKSTCTKPPKTNLLIGIPFWQEWIHQTYHLAVILVENSPSCQLCYQSLTTPPWCSWPGAIKTLNGTEKTHHQQQLFSLRFSFWQISLSPHHAAHQKSCT